MRESTNEQPAVKSVVASDRAGRVRSRVIKGVVVFTLAGLAYAGVVTLGRDQTRIRQAADDIAPIPRARQAVLCETGRLPLKLPSEDPDGVKLTAKGFTYLSTGEIRSLRDADHPVIIGYSPRVAAVLLTPGRWALMCDGDRCYTEWYTSAQFAERMLAQDAWIEDRREQLLKHGPKLP